jgi:hypothetical protein
VTIETSNGNDIFICCCCILLLRKRCVILTVTGSQGSSVRKVTDYRLDNWFWFLEGQGFLSLHQHVRTHCVAYPASYPMCIGGSFRGGKAAEV